MHWAKAMALGIRILFLAIILSLVVWGLAHAIRGPWRKKLAGRPHRAARRADKLRARLGWEWRAQSYGTPMSDKSYNFPAIHHATKKTQRLTATASSAERRAQTGARIS
jgi:hypothetical protein